MKHFSERLARDNYNAQLQILFAEGSPVEVRGRSTVELLDVYTEIKEPQHHCILIPSRRWNPWLALSEFLWIMGGDNEFKDILPYNRNIANYSDDGTTLYGAYGYRIYWQINDLVYRLERDPTDRRAVLAIWNAPDLYVNSKDPPCNNLLYFKIREGKLNMTVINRSNDIHWGLYAVNIPTFGLLQEYLASRLNVDLGVQAHLSNSFHVYTDQRESVQITKRMLKDPVVSWYPRHRMAFEKGELTYLDGNLGHYDIARYCREVLKGTYQGDLPFLKFAQEFLTMYRERSWRPDALDQDFADWIEAGEIFVRQVWKHQTITP